VVGVIGADITIDALTRRILATRFGERGYGFLLNRNGDVIARPEITAGNVRWDETYPVENLVTAENASLRALAEEMVAGRSGVGVIEGARGEEFVAYAPIPNAHWIFALALPVADVRAPAHATQARLAEQISRTSGEMDSRTSGVQASFMAVFAILLTLVIAATIVVSRTITGPIQRVALAAGSLERGELNDAQIATLREQKGEDEVAALSRVFASMAAEVRAREQQLRMQIQALRVEIDESKRDREVAEVTESEFFRDLQSRARRRRQVSGKAENPGE
jgi:sigma-B regulation protein RsbU (phosphoserine phosphatase)